MVKGIRAGVLGWLASHFPSTLKDYKSITRSSQPSAEYMVRCWRAIEIAEEFSFPLILPAALYACSMMDDDHIRELRSLYLSKLHPRILGKVESFRERFNADKYSRLHRFVKPESVQCHNPNRTHSLGPPSRRCLMWARYLESWERPGSDIFRESVTSGLEPCAECVDGMNHDEEDMKTILWSRLPLHCGLGDWTKVRLQQEEADREDAVAEGMSSLLF